MPLYNNPVPAQQTAFATAVQETVRHNCCPLVELTNDEVVIEMFSNGRGKMKSCVAVFMSMTFYLRAEQEFEANF